MSKIDRWFPFDVGAYLGDTMHLQTVEHGAYVLLLMHYWRKGPLPNDDAKLAAIARLPRPAWDDMAETLRAFFTVGDDGLLHQKRADAELERTRQISAKRAEAGKIGAEAKHGGKRDGKTLANAKQLPPQVQRQIQEEDSELRSGADAPGEDLFGDKPPPKSPLWTEGPDLLMRRCSMSRSGAGGFITRLAKAAGGYEAAWAIIRACPEDDGAPQRWMMDRAKRAGQKAKIPTRNDPPEAWAAYADAWEEDAKGVRHPVCGGFHFDVAVDLICEAAGIHRYDWQGDWDTIAKWLRDDLDLNAHIVPAIRERARWRGYSPPDRLAYFDASVRNKASQRRAA